MRERKTWRWSQETKDLVAKHYPVHGAIQTARIIGGMTSEQVWGIAHKLGLTKRRKQTRKGPSPNATKRYDYRALQDAVRNMIIVAPETEGCDLR